MKLRRDRTRNGCYTVEVYTKGILRVSGKRRVDLNLRIIRDGSKDDREFLLYISLMKNVKTYLSKKYANHSKVRQNKSICNVKLYMLATMIRIKVFLVSSYFWRSWHSPISEWQWWRWELQGHHFYSGEQKSHGI